MPNFSRRSVILVRYPFADLTSSKVRPAVIVNGPHVSTDLLITPITSRVAELLAGEFVLADWAIAGLHVPSAVKRGIYTMESRLVLKHLGQLSDPDGTRLDAALRGWLTLP